MSGLGEINYGKHTYHSADLAPAIILKFRSLTIVVSSDLHG